MKLFNILAVSFLCGGFMLHAQLPTAVVDPVVFVQKKQITGILASGLGLKATELGQLTALVGQMNLYDSKRGGVKSAAISGVAIFGTLQTMISTLGLKIADIEYNIGLRKLTSFGYGLARFESQLKREKQYFEWLKEQYTIVMGATLASGGAGYTYTALLKLLIHVMEIRSKITRIDKEVKAGMKVSRLLAR